MDVNSDFFHKSEAHNKMQMKYRFQNKVFDGQENWQNILNISPHEFSSRKKTCDSLPD